MKNIIVVTGGAGFVGSNLIKHLINKTKFNRIESFCYPIDFTRLVAGRGFEPLTFRL